MNDFEDLFELEKSKYKEIPEMYDDLKRLKVLWD